MVIVLHCILTLFWLFHSQIFLSLFLFSMSYCDDIWLILSLFAILGTVNEFFCVTGNISDVGVLLANFNIHMDVMTWETGYFWEHRCFVIIKSFFEALFSIYEKWVKMFQHDWLNVLAICDLVHGWLSLVAVSHLVPLWWIHTQWARDRSHHLHDFSSRQVTENIIRIPLTLAYRKHIWRPLIKLKKKYNPTQSANYPCPLHEVQSFKTRENILKTPLNMVQPWRVGNMHGDHNKTYKPKSLLKELTNPALLVRYIDLRVVK